MSDVNFQSEEFVARLRAHDDDAWQLLLPKARKRLEALFEIVDLADLAQDLTSQTLVRLIKSKFMNYDREKSSVLTWIVNTGKLIALEHFAREARQPKLQFEFEVQFEIEEMIDPDSWPLEERSGESKRGKLTKRALESLSEDERIILLLRFGEGLSFDEIAENLEITQNNARVRVSRARKKLRLEFERLNRESRKRTIRSGPRNTGPSTSPPSSEKIQVTARW